MMKERGNYILARGVEWLSLAVVVPVVLLSLIDEAHAAYMWDTPTPIEGDIETPLEGTCVPVGETIDYSVTNVRDKDTKRLILGGGQYGPIEYEPDSFDWPQGITWVTAPENMGSFSDQSYDPDTYICVGTWTAPTDYIGPVTLGVQLNDKAEMPCGDQCAYSWCRDDGFKSMVVDVYVVDVDLDIHNGGSDLDNGGSGPTQGAAVADDDEESVGAYLLVNWDNDDGDNPPVPDLDESSVTNEDNLAKLVPSLAPSGLETGTVELEVTGGAIKIWRSSTKGTELTLTASKKTWDLTSSSDRTDFNSACTDGLWIEGTDWSNERAITIKLAFKNPYGQEVDSDTVKATSVILRIGDGVYREKSVDFQERGHAGVLSGYTGDCAAADFNDDTNYKVIYMPGIGSGSEYTTLDDFTNTAGLDYWGTYTCASPSTTYTQRLKVMKSAEDIKTENPSYVWEDVLQYKGNNWDGTVGDIKKLRCDGVVEVAYEINDIDVWGKTNGATHFDIRDYLSEHNDYDPVYWADTLMPATQCGHETPVDAETTFSSQPICLPTSLRP